nr:protein MKS1-like [Ipomoea batatas]
MDPPLSGFSSGTGERPSPTRRELQLQGPRPTPLRVNKDSYKIKKPPVAPQPQQQLPPAAATTTTQNQPVIIYSVSPKVIHTTVSDFMGVVQRLTGSSSSSQLGQTSGSSSGSGDLSPAARLASIEKTNPGNIIACADVVTSDISTGAVLSGVGPVDVDAAEQHVSQPVGVVFSSTDFSAENYSVTSPVSFHDVADHIDGDCVSTATHSGEVKGLDVISHIKVVDDDGGERRVGAKPTAVNHQYIDILRRKFVIGEQLLENGEEDHADFINGFLVA